jgi:hypothetical protein
LSQNKEHPVESAAIDYADILLSSNPDDIIAYLFAELPYQWCERYDAITPHQTEILQFTVDGFEFLFDLSTGTENNPSEERVVAAFGKSHTPIKERDSSRMKGFLGPSAKVFGDGFDKGHFIGHSLGGGLDVNLFPQRRDINRGWSKRGKVFRAMEKYCADNPGTFCFSRPIYNDLTWRPHLLEYGLLNADGTLWVELFENEQGN